MTSTFDSIDKNILKSVKLSEKSSTSSKSNTHSESKESIWALTQAYILSALQFLRSIVFKLTGIKPNTPPATNYILMLFLFAKDTVIAPIATKLSSLEQSQQFVVIGLSAFFLWLPALILTFWLLPTLVCLTTVFYLLMFGFEPFMTHMDETLTELTGWTTSDLKGFTSELSKNANELTKNATENLKGKTKITEKEVLAFLQKRKQYAIATFGQFSVHLLHAILYLIKSLENVLTQLLDKVLGQQKEVTKKME